MSVSQKINHLTHTLLYCIRSWGHPLPTCAKNLCLPLRPTWSSVTSGSYTCIWKSQLKSMGNIPFGRFSVNCGGLTLLLETCADLFPRPKFCSCKVRTHATEISRHVWSSVTSGSYTCIWKSPN